MAPPRGCGSSLGTPNPCPPAPNKPPPWLAASGLGGPPPGTHGARRGRPRPRRAGRRAPHNQAEAFGQAHGAEGRTAAVRAADFGGDGGRDAAPCAAAAATAPGSRPAAAWHVHNFLTQLPRRVSPAGRPGVGAGLGPARGVMSGACRQDSRAALDCPRARHRSLLSRETATTRQALACATFRGLLQIAVAGTDRALDARPRAPCRGRLWRQPNN
jgi:hypothetical protein